MSIIIPTALLGNTSFYARENEVHMCAHASTHTRELSVCIKSVYVCRWRRELRGEGVGDGRGGRMCVFGFGVKI